MAYPVRLSELSLSRTESDRFFPPSIPAVHFPDVTHFDRFNLNAQEGYLVSLIDGRLDLQKLMILSPFDPFNTIFILAKLQNERAIVVPQ